MHATRVLQDISCGTNFKNVFSWCAACNRPQYILVVGCTSATLRTWIKCVRVFTSRGIASGMTMHVVSQNQMRRRADLCSPESFANACCVLSTQSKEKDEDASASVLVILSPTVTSDVLSVSTFSLCYNWNNGEVRNDQTSSDVDVYVLISCETTFTSASSFTELSGISREDKVTKHLVAVM